MREKQVIGYSFAPSYGVALPGSPANGQEHILVDSITSPTWHWRMRYNSGSAHSEKWEFVGGTALYAEVVTRENTAGANAYQATATPGPIVAVPVAGLYEMGIGFASWTVSGHSNQYMSYDIGGTGAVDADGVFGVGRAAVDEVVSDSRFYRKQFSVVTLTAKYKGNGAVASVSNRWMRLQPVRLS